MSVSKLDPARLHEALRTLPAWHHADERGGTITREFRFDGFAQAFAFMTLIAIEADKRDHHPEWSNVYDRVTITLTTHDAGGLTLRDVELARLADQAHARFAQVK